MTVDLDPEACEETVQVMAAAAFDFGWFWEF